MSTTPSVPRYKTAIRRGDLSSPIKCALRDDLIPATSSLLDYGCGHGEDIELLTAKGIRCRGWDPVFRPGELGPAEVVNLGYILNVIEDPHERSESLRRAWGLARHLLIVSAQVEVAGRGGKYTQFGDGCLSRRGTFQKFYKQDELRQYLEAELDAEAVPASLGVFYVFKDEGVRQQFLAKRFRHRPSAPRKRLSELRFEEHRSLLESLIETATALGRLPKADECPGAEQIISQLGSLKRAFALVRRVTGEEEWDTLRRQRTDDYLVYLALARFQKRPPISKLPLGLQRDIRAFFGSYAQACRLADDLLFQAGDAGAIDTACRSSTIGKLLPNALYVHQKALGLLAPLLRVYEGCARAYLGEIEGANIIKLHRFSGKVSYLTYPGFESVPHPSLVRCIKLSLRTRQLDCYDYAAVDNPPILHRKETVLSQDDPLYQKFARLTSQEERYGLLEDTATIGTRLGWEDRLRQNGLTLKGHRLVREAKSGAT
jgi:DNA phosphorothioation-associated putative methyltransferase